MARVADFRKSSQFSSEKIRKCGINVGRVAYPKLYGIENLLRILVHSILTAQQTLPGIRWWESAVAPGIRGSIANQRDKALNRISHTAPGEHEIYYTTLGQLIDIIRTNSGSFVYLIPDIEKWVTQIELVRPARNLTAHMNFPKTTDRKRIDALYKDLDALMDSLSESSAVPWLIP